MIIIRTLHALRESFFTLLKDVQVFWKGFLRIFSSLSLDQVLKYCVSKISRNVTTNLSDGIEMEILLQSIANQLVIDRSRITISILLISITTLLHSIGSQMSIQVNQIVNQTVNALSYYYWLSIELEFFFLYYCYYYYWSSILLTTTIIGLQLKQNPYSYTTVRLEQNPHSCISIDTISHQLEQNPHFHTTVGYRLEQNAHSCTTTITIGHQLEQNPHSCTTVGYRLEQYPHFYTTNLQPILAYYLEGISYLQNSAYFNSP